MVERGKAIQINVQKLKCRKILIMCRKIFKNTKSYSKTYNVTRTQDERSIFTFYSIIFNVRITRNKIIISNLKGRELQNHGFGVGMRMGVTRCN